MCRNIKVLFNYEPPATEMEVRASATQFVRKIGGGKPSKANEAAYETAIEQITAITETLLASLVTTASPKDRDVEAAKAKARSVKRFGG